MASASKAEDELTSADAGGALFAPRQAEEVEIVPKSDRFGLGYDPLRGSPELSGGGKDDARPSARRQRRLHDGDDEDAYGGTADMSQYDTRLDDEEDGGRGGERGGGRGELHGHRIDQWFEIDAADTSGPILRAARCPDDFDEIHRFRRRRHRHHCRRSSLSASASTARPRRVAQGAALAALGQRGAAPAAAPAAASSTRPRRAGCCGGQRVDLVGKEDMVALWQRVHALRQAARHRRRRLRHRAAHPLDRRRRRRHRRSGCDRRRRRHDRRRRRRQGSRRRCRGGGGASARRMGAAGRHETHAADPPRQGRFEAFLTDEATARRLAAAAGLSAQDVRDWRIREGCLVLCAQGTRSSQIDSRRGASRAE